MGDQVADSQPGESTAAGWAQLSHDQTRGLIARFDRSAYLTCGLGHADREGRYPGIVSSGERRILRRIR